jgi:hypothetical protein
MLQTKFSAGQTLTGLRKGGWHQVAWDDGDSRWNTLREAQGFALLEDHLAFPSFGSVKVLETLQTLIEMQFRSVKETVR